MIEKKDETEREIKLYEINNCMLVGRNDYFPNILIYECDAESIIDPYSEQVMSLGKTSFYNQNYSFELNHTNEICDEPVYFFIYNVDNYYHFIYDTLPYLYNYLKLNLNCKILLNFNNEINLKLYEFVSDTLKLLEIFDKVIIHKKNTVYKKMYISSSLTFDFVPNNPPRKEIFFIYDLLKNNTKLKSENYQEDQKNKFPDKIYVSRRTWIHNKLDNIGTNYTQRRKMINEDELVKKLTEKGFVEVFPENMSMSDKIMMFENAKYVIGSIGGGLCNLLFSSKLTKSICIVSPHFLEINQRFKFSMEISNIKYFNDTNIFIENGQEIPNYVRVKINNKNSKYYGMLGEIENYNKNNFKYIVKLSEGVAGWNALNNFETCEFDFFELEQLDNGLNSPYSVDIDKLMDLI